MRLIPPDHFSLSLFAYESSAEKHEPRPRLPPQHPPRHPLRPRLEHGGAVHAADLGGHADHAAVARDIRVAGVFCRYGV